MPAYYITGIAGTGKSTVAEELQKHGKTSYDIDSKGICHWRHKLTKKKSEYYTGIGKKFLETHEYICDEEKLKELIRSNQDIFIVGICANQNDLFKYFDKIFLLYCSTETFVKRINERTGPNQFGKDASEQEQLIVWSKDLNKTTQDSGGIPINTEESVEKVVESILSHL